MRLVRRSLGVQDPHCLFRTGVNAGFGTIGGLNTRSRVRGSHMLALTVSDLAVPLLPLTASLNDSVLMRHTMFIGLTRWLRIVRMCRLRITASLSSTRLPPWSMQKQTSISLAMAFHVDLPIPLKFGLVIRHGIRGAVRCCSARGGVLHAFGADPRDSRQ
ncbi:uncharacterized protein CC84DRAFT_557514 [Paraphaeosphaeria sporulosa]|uniref:Uncharacterized protein n=1 Tax=Paraphaeosphaeria sporulosa TaxID=1460663 RepID=A0A177CKU9_9PLEO|nr:uncharacterized protein CC84DRAFT_557514 [Paraphaeosphaeria sporulosa]OAG08155.1 hypothetical protein CC84DRAFT_557514 [Paraphaeosphaeria sporulosa]